MIWRCVICFVFVALTLNSLLSHINSAYSRSRIALFVELMAAPKSIESTTHCGITFEETTTNTWKVAAASRGEGGQQRPQAEKSHQRCAVTRGNTGQLMGRWKTEKMQKMECSPQCPHNILEHLIGLRPCTLQFYSFI